MCFCNHVALPTAPVVTTPTTTVPAAATTAAAPVVSAPTVTVPRPTQPSNLVISADGTVSVYDRAGKAMPTASRGSTSKPVAVQSANRRGQIMSRGAQAGQPNSWPGTSAPTRTNVTSGQTSIQNMPLGNTAPASENILRAAFQQRLDAVQTSAGAFLPLQKSPSKAKAAQ